MGLLILAVVCVAGSAPAACGVCHAAQTAALASSAHEGVSCYGCHGRADAGVLGRKIDEFARMYPRAMLGGSLASPAVLTPRTACLACHADVLARVTASPQGVRIDHAACAAASSCDECHSSVAHGKAVRWRSAPLMDACTSCHRARGVAVECEGCHTGGRSAERGNGPWQVTHGPNWRTTHGMGDTASCGTCHDATYCARCHGIPLPHGRDFGAQHGRLARAKADSCATCHRTSTFCDACHGIRMPHPAGFLRDHPATVKSGGDASCERCHVRGDCESCHVRHVHPAPDRLPRSHA